MDAPDFLLCQLANFGHAQIGVVAGDAARNRHRIPRVKQVLLEEQAESGARRAEDAQHARRFRVVADFAAVCVAVEERVDFGAEAGREPLEDHSPGVAFARRRQGRGEREQPYRRTGRKVAARSRPPIPLHLISLGGEPR